VGRPVPVAMDKYKRYFSHHAAPASKAAKSQSRLKITSILVVGAAALRERECPAFKRASLHTGDNAHRRPKEKNSEHNKDRPMTSGTTLKRHVPFGHLSFHFLRHF
jgi:hypothetical protein